MMYPASKAEKRDKLMATIRAVMNVLGMYGATMTTRQIAYQLDGLIDYDRERLYAWIAELISTGEAERVRTGVYRWIGWSGMDTHARRAVWKNLKEGDKWTATALAKETGVERVFVKATLQLLKSHGLVREVPGKKYRLLYKKTETEGASC